MFLEVSAKLKVFMLHEDITGKIIAAFYAVYKKLGFGFLEKVYENALAIELRKHGLKIDKQKQIKVYYETDLVGDYYADIIVDDKVIIELKAAEGLVEEHEHQLMNYLKATPIEVGLLLNFGTNPQFKRKIFTNDKKPHLNLIPSVQTAVPKNPSIPSSSVFLFHEK
jgi:GxxExxY protein